MGNKAPEVDPKEVARQNKRMISKSIRTVEREQKKLMAQEAKLLKDIKALATKNQHGPAKLLSKDLVRQRAQVNQYYTMISQLKAIEMQLSTATINQSMIDALKGANQVMVNVNENMDVAGIRDVLREFSK
jgi:charged multivesicular body protein 2A